MVFFFFFEWFWFIFAVEILVGRQRKAEALKKLTDVAVRMSDEQLVELRADIKVKFTFFIMVLAQHLLPALNPQNSPQRRGVFFVIFWVSDSFKHTIFGCESVVLRFAADTLS